MTTSQVESKTPIGVGSKAIVRRAVFLALVCSFLLVVWFVSDAALTQIASISAAIVLIFLGGREIIAWYASTQRHRRSIERIQDILEDDSTPAVFCNSDNEIIWTNKSANQMMPDQEVASLTVGQLVADHLSAADQVLRRVKLAAQADGKACETVVGIDTALRVHLRRFGDCDLWRFELRAGEKEDGDASVPSILLGRNGVVLSMNEPARALVGTRAKSAATLFRTDQLPDEGAIPLMTATGEVLVHIKKRETGVGRTRILLTPVSDEVPVFESGLDDLPLPAMKISAHGTVLTMNALAGNLLSMPTLVGNALSSVLVGLNRPVDDIIHHAALDGAVYGPEILKVKTSEAEAYVQMTIKRVMNRSSVYLVAIVSDATKLKSLEAQFVQGQKMQAIGQLAGGVAHDFNNLLTAISGHCDLMLLRHDQGDQDYADLIQIHQNANRAATLVTQLLAFSRKQTLQPECLDLRDTLSDLTHLLNRLVGEKVSLMLSHDPVLRPIRADKRQLEQVIMNLVVNARDAMPDGGQVSIETESLTLSKPLHRDRVTVPKGEYVVVRVRDQGVGIHPDALPKIFEPFFTTKRTGDGTGLGLSTAYGIVKQTGGYIFVDSKLGHGTSFSLMFAAQTPTAEIKSEAAPPEPKQSQELCEGVVLLVEDESPVRAFASRALSMRGFDVLEAASAEEALALLEDDDLDVDVFVTDVVMPGQDGPTWVRKALKKRPDVRVVFVSGYAEGAFEGDGPKIPGSIFLPKPFSLSDLTSTVQKQIA